MMRELRATPLRLWLFVAAALTAGALGAYIVMQQIERQGANDPQIQLAEDGAAALERGRPVAQVVPADTVDVARSLAPVVIVLDDVGRLVASSAQLDGQTPVPPTGVLATVRTFGEERVTWAPRPSVRLASVVRRFGGLHPGFIVAARSLRETEWRVGRMIRLIAVAWCICMVAMTAGIGIATWLSSRGHR